MNCLDLYETFLKEEVTENEVLVLDKEDLSTMGIKVGKQRRFLQAKQKYEEGRKITGNITNTKKFDIISYF